MKKHIDGWYRHDFLNRRTGKMETWVLKNYMRFLRIWFFNKILRQ